MCRGALVADTPLITLVVVIYRNIPEPDLLNQWVPSSLSSRILNTTCMIPFKEAVPYFDSAAVFKTTEAGAGGIGFSPKRPVAHSSEIRMALHIQGHLSDTKRSAIVNFYLVS